MTEFNLDKPLEELGVCPVCGDALVPIEFRFGRYAVCAKENRVWVVSWSMDWIGPEFDSPEDQRIAKSFEKGNADIATRWPDAEVFRKRREKWATIFAQNDTEIDTK
jgi:hypothetical protein